MNMYEYLRFTARRILDLYSMRNSILCHFGQNVPLFLLVRQISSHALPSLEYALFHVKTRLLVSVFTCFFLLVSFLDGFVGNVTAVSLICDRNRKYFKFTLQGNDEEKRALSFSPKKHKLLLKSKINKQAVK